MNSDSRNPLIESFNNLRTHFVHVWNVTEVVGKVVYQWIGLHCALFHDLAQILEISEIWNNNIFHFNHFQNHFILCSECVMCRFLLIFCVGLLCEGCFSLYLIVENGGGGHDGLEEKLIETIIVSVSNHHTSCFRKISS